MSDIEINSLESSLDNLVDHSDRVMVYGFFDFGTCQLGKKLENMGKTPIVITSPIVRMYFKKLTEDYFKDLIVVSYNEVESNIELQSVGMVTA